MDIFPWLAALSTTNHSSPPPLDLVCTTAKSIVLKAELSPPSPSDADETLLTFSVCLHGPHTSTTPSKTLWVSDPCPLSAPHTLLLQLLQQLIARSPSPDHSASLPSSHDLPIPSATTPTFPNFLTLLFLCRLFYLCACDSTPDVGALFFQMLNANIERALDCKVAVKELLVSAGFDWELCFMRAVGYMLAKWCILRDLSPPAPNRNALPCSFSYSVNQHGLWVLRGYAPISAMGVTHQHGLSHLEAREPLLRYALAHQQLEAVVQFEHSVCFQDHRFIRVAIRVDNIRIHVTRLGYKEQDSSAPDERHFPSRVRIRVGPDPALSSSRRVAALSLGRSTGNPERETEREQVVKGRFGGEWGSKKGAAVKAEARAATREKGRSWRWEQEAEGNSAVFEGVLCDSTSGREVAAEWRPPPAAGGGMRRRYSGSGRVLSKKGGVVVAGDEFGEWVSWRVGREMEGGVLRWKVSGKVWVTYWPNEVKSEYLETRCVEWAEEVELDLTPRGQMV